MNLVDRYLTECVNNRNYNWIISNLYINEDQLFNPTYSQQEILLANDKHKAFLLPRNTGSSTLICMDAIAQAMLNPNQEIMIFAPNQSSSRSMLRRIRDILRYSDLTIVRVTNDYICFLNGSIIRLFTPICASWRGYHGQVIYIDNFDMINSEELSNIFCRLMHSAEKILILGNDMNGLQSTQRMININPREIQ